MASSVSILALFAATTVVSWFGVGLMRAVATRCNIVAVPNERSSHAAPIPLCGGIALVAITVAAWLFYDLLTATMPSRHVLSYLAAALVVAGVSLVDDLHHVPYPIRLLVQAGAATVVLAGSTSWQIVTVPILGTLNLEIFGTVLSFVWIVGLTNAFNFMDGIDGMAGGQALAAGLGWMALGSLTHHPHLMVLGALLAASSLGFLGHNWQPATIFMGDVGATFLGFSFAVLPILESRADPRLALSGVLLVWPVIFDAGFTVLRRLREGENIFAGHRTFLFHRLVATGWSHAQASALYCVLPILGAVFALTWAEGTPLLHASVMLFIVSSCAGLWGLVRHQEHRIETRDAPEPFRILAESASNDTYIESWDELAV